MKRKTLKQLKKKTWELVSIHVRSEGQDFAGYVSCFTCGIRKHWKEMHCGHYIHNKLDFDMRNLKPQCPRCNKFLRGNLGVYSERLIREHGLDWVEKLRKDAYEKGNNYTREELIKIIEMHTC